MTTTTTPTIDRMDVREKLAAYDDACVARETAKEAEESSIAGALFAKREEAIARHTEERNDIYRRHRAEIDAVNDEIRSATAEIEARYNAMPEIEEPDIGTDEPLDWGGFGDPMSRCAKSGVVLLEGDELLEDPDTGAQYLRSALGLPPRAVEKAADAAPDAQSVSAGAMT